MDIVLFAASVAVTKLASKRKDLGGTTTKSLEEQWKDGTTLNAKERVATVTADNEPIEGGHLRADMRAQKLWHRATFCIVKHQPAHIGQHEDTYVLIQKRSSIKDYCPGKFDATPGGVVGYQESYRDNILRELEEEMGIDVNHPKANFRRLFTFPYKDDVVNFWGEMYECTYTGPLKDLKLQEEEVDEVLRLSLTELKEKMRKSPGDFMPDSIHACQLYLQHLGDLKVDRRFLKGSSSDLNHYRIRPKPKVIFFDCDDCLYFDGWKTAKKLTSKIDEWCTTKGGLKHGHAYQLYKQYGTALRGLLAEKYLENNKEAIDGYLRYVHNIGVKDTLKPDPKLRAMLERMDPSIPRFIFTASVEHHARACVEALGIADLFNPTIIDCKKCDFESKHSQHSFRVAMKVASITNDPEECIFFDDSVTNIKSARHIGWRGILVGKIGRDTGKPITSEHAEMEVNTIHEIEKVCPELFLKESK